MLAMSLFLIGVTVIIFARDSFIRWRSVLLEGEIIGFTPPVRGQYGNYTYGYRIKIEYKGETYHSKALQGKTKIGKTYPSEMIGRKCQVYFNPKSPKLVSMKGFHGLHIALLFIFILGLLGLILALG